jgi:choline-sulfatase
VSNPPNILWICTDQQRFDTLGCYGNGFVETPNTDRLAQNGALFERAYAQSPVCTPSRASFLTGRYPRTTRCRQNGQSIPADEVLVTRLLADAGYACGLAGKLHISACHPSVSPLAEPRVDDGYAEFRWSHQPDSHWPTNEYSQWLHERGKVFGRKPFRGSRRVQVSVPAEYHQTTWCAQKAIDFIEVNAAFDNPWLFSVNIFDPHHPFDPPREYLERYLDRLDEIPLPSYVPGELDDKPAFQRTDHEGAYGGTAGYPFGEMTGEEHRLVRAAYWAMCDLIDDQVGRMLDALERTGQLEDTLVVFMSDHGEMLGDHGLYLKGPHFYEPAVRVPLIVSRPGTIAPGRRSGALVELVDLAPTLLEAAGLPPHSGMQGRSLWPMLTGAASPERHREDVYCEYYGAMPWHKDPAAHATMVRTESHKLVAYHTVRTGGASGELYDLEQDPNETSNLWDEPAHAGLKCDMLQRLCDRMAWTADPLPRREAVW